MSRTTVDLPDALMIRVKKKAAELRVPMRSLLENALRDYLEKLSSKPKKPTKIRWKTVPGAVSSDLDISSREKMHEWLRGGSDDRG